MIRSDELLKIHNLRAFILGPFQIEIAQTLRHRPDFSISDLPIVDSDYGG